MGKYDLPATIEFISKATEGKKIIFIGHSIAASVFHVFEDYHRGQAKNSVAAAIFIAPIVFLTDLKPPQPEYERLGHPLKVKQLNYLCFTMFIYAPLDFSYTFRC